MRAGSKQSGEASDLPSSHRKTSASNTGIKIVGQKDVILKNKAEKLLKTNGNGQKTNRNKPENKAEKLLKTRSCGKNKPETNRKTKLPILLKTNEGQKRT